MKKFNSGLKQAEVSRLHLAFRHNAYGLSVSPSHFAPFRFEEDMRMHKNGNQRISHNLRIYLNDIVIGNIDVQHGDPEFMFLDFVQDNLIEHLLIRVRKMSEIATQISAIMRAESKETRRVAKLLKSNEYWDGRFDPEYVKTAAAGHFEPVNGMRMLITDRYVRILGVDPDTESSSQAFSFHVGSRYQVNSDAISEILVRGHERFEATMNASELRECASRVLSGAKPVSRDDVLRLCLTAKGQAKSAHSNDFSVMAESNALFLSWRGLAVGTMSGMVMHPDYYVHAPYNDHDDWKVKFRASCSEMKSALSGYDAVELCCQIAVIDIIPDKNVFVQDQDEIVRELSEQDMGYDF